MQNWIVKEKENNNHVIIVKKDGTTQFNKDDFWINGDTVKISPLHNSDTFRIFYSTYDKLRYVIALMNYMNDEERTDLHNRLEQLLKMFIDKNISIQYDESLKIQFKINNENNEIIDEAEQKILYELDCLLESTLEEPFMENYKDLINIAKKSIINNTQAVD